MPATPVHKEALIRTAMRLFRRQGYASTGLNQILSESGAPKGSLYHYFPKGKEELALAAVELAGNLIREMLEKNAREKRTIRTFVQSYCDTMADWMDESGFKSGCPIATIMLETAPDSPSLTAAGKAAITSWVEVIAMVFTQAGKPQTEADREALALVSQVQGALIIARVWGSAKPIRDVGRSNDWMK